MRLAQKSVCGGRRTGQGCQKPRCPTGPTSKVILWLNDLVSPCDTITGPQKDFEITVPGHLILEIRKLRPRDRK